MKIKKPTVYALVLILVMSFPTLISSQTIIEGLGTCSYQDAIAIDEGVLVSELCQLNQSPPFVDWSISVNKFDLVGNLLAEWSISSSSLPQGNWTSSSSLFIRDNSGSIILLSSLVKVGEQPDTNVIDLGLDTTYLYTQEINLDMGPLASSLTPLSSVAHKLRDVRFDEDEGKYISSWSLLISFSRLISFDEAWNVVDLGEARSDFDGLSNLDQHYPIAVDADNSNYLLRTSRSDIQRFTFDLDHDSTIAYQELTWDVPYLGSWLTSGMVDTGEGFYSLSYDTDKTYWNNICPYVTQANYDGTYINEFWFPNPDSTIIGSNNRTLCQAQDEGFLLGYHIRPNMADEAKHFKVVKCDDQGELLWQTVFGEGDKEYTFQKIVELDDGAITVIGSRDEIPSALNTKTTVIYFLNENGEVVTEVNELEKIQVGIFPNPTHDKCRVELGKVLQSWVLRNAQGSTLEYGGKSKSGFIEIDLSFYPPGIYLLDLDVEGLLIRRKLVRN